MQPTKRDKKRRDLWDKQRKASRATKMIVPRRRTGKMREQAGERVSFK